MKLSCSQPSPTCLPPWLQPIQGLAMHFHLPPHEFHCYPLNGGMCHWLWLHLLLASAPTNPKGHQKPLLLTNLTLYLYYSAVPLGKSSNKVLAEGGSVGIRNYVCPALQNKWKSPGGRMPLTVFEWSVAVQLNMLFRREAALVFQTQRLVALFPSLARHHCLICFGSTRFGKWSRNARFQFQAQFKHVHTEARGKVIPDHCFHLGWPCVPL